MGRLALHPQTRRSEEASLTGRQAPAELDTAAARVEAARRVARQAEEEARRYLKLAEHLGGVLRSSGVRRQSAWTCTPRARRD